MIVSRDKLKSIVLLFVWILAFQAVSAAIGIATVSDIKEWYGTIVRPAFAPPSYVFSIVWPALYVMIAGAGWRIFFMGNKESARQLGWLFAAYMALNWTWSFIFFGLHMILAGFVWILLLDVLALWLILRAWRTDRYVSYLMLPPLGWMVFAAFLNGAYWLLNT